jgi:hypothetical protein
VAKLEVTPAAGGKAFAVTAVLLALAGLAAAAATNILVDPRGEFPPDLFRPIVADTTAASLARFQERQGPLETLVLGSSRASLLPPGPGGFNFAIQGGGLQDDRLVYEYVRANGPAPRRVVLGLDSFQLTARDLRDIGIRRSATAPEIMGEPLDVGGWASRVMETLAYDYALDSARDVYLTATSGFDDPFMEIAADGRTAWATDQELRDAGTFDLAPRLERSWRVHIGPRYPDDAVVDAAAVAEARSLIEEIRGDGVEVDVVLLPFHPEMMPHLEATPSFGPLQAAARQIGLDACGPGVSFSFYDFTELSSFGGVPDGFYDGYHMAPENSDLVAARMAAGEGDLCVTANAG